jgi:2-haloacid dehalogenase
MPRTPDTVVFDIGNVLIHWDPRALYREIFSDPEDMAHFLEVVCPPEFNLSLDRGRSFKEAIAERLELHPEHAEAIVAWDERWQEMVPGEIADSVAILEELRTAGVPLYAITNFSREKFAECEVRFPFLTEAFHDVVVSAHEGVLKPDPAIYQVLFARNAIVPEQTIFIDDSAANVAAARDFGMHAHHFTGADGLRAALEEHGFPLASRG